MTLPALLLFLQAATTTAPQTPPPAPPDGQRSRLDRPPERRHPLATDHARRCAPRLH